MNQKQASYEFDGFRLVPAEQLLLRGDERISLRPKTFHLLLVLVQNSGRLLEKQTLLSEIWGETNIEEGNLNRTISELRKQLGDAREESKYIETVPRVGYRFIATVTAGPAAGETAGTDANVPVGVRSEAADVADRETLPQRRSGRGGLAYAGAIVLAAMMIGVWAIRSFSPSARSTRTEYGENQLTFGPRDHFHASWTSDGRIRFAEDGDDKNWAWSSVDPDGTKLAGEPDQISPDGRFHLVFGGDKRTIYVTNTDGSAKRPLPIFFGNLDWSPVSNEIVVEFAPDGKREAMDIAIIDLDTLSYKNITNSPTFEADPSFSPDGSQILFTSFREGNAEIYLMNRDGSNIQRLTDSPANESYASFSPDGTQISFNSDRENEKNNVYIMNLDGSGKLTALPRGDFVNGVGTRAWSPDGTQLTFSSDRSGVEQIYVTGTEFTRPVEVLSDAAADLSGPVMSGDGQTLVYLAKTGRDSFELRKTLLGSSGSSVLVKLSNETNVDLSPDGKKVAFQMKVDGNSEIFTIDIDGSNLINLTNNAAQDVSPTFSRDGRSVYFASNRGGNFGVFGIYKMNADGSDQELVYYTPNGTSFDPRCSPDGSVFFSNDKEDGRNGNFEIFSISDSGGVAVRKTFRPGYYDAKPSISPDGRHVAFQSLRQGNSEIYVMNPDGSGVLRITRNLADDRDPTWSIDGRSIFFSSNRNGKHAIFKIEL